MAYDRRPPPLTESSITRGVHGGLSPDALPQGYIAQGANISVRGGFVSSRPRFRVIGSHTLTGTFQGAGVYSLASGDRIIFGDGANVMEFDPGTGTVETLYTFPSDTGPHYHVQADRYFVVQNNQDRPMFHHRDNFTRAALPEGSEERELPTGSLMAYAHGRVFLVPRYLYDNNGDVTEEDGRAYWMAGDVLLPLSPSNVLKVTEDEYWNEGGATPLPFEAGNITALGVLQNAQGSGTGVGALLAFGRTGVSAYSVAANRSDWKDLDFSQVLFTGAGTQSPRSVLPVNDDILFRATDGLRSLRVSSQQSQGGGGWSIRPISYEVDHRLKFDAPSDLPGVTTSFSGNRFLLTTGGRNSVGVYRGLLSLDTLVASTLSQGSAPAYDDIWVSRPVLATLQARVAGKTEHVILHRHGGNEITFSVLDDEVEQDFGTNFPTSRAYTRAYTTASTNLLSLTFMDVIFRDIRGPFVARAYYRTDLYSRWTPFHGTFEVDGPTRKQMRFSAARDGCREDGSPPHVGHNVQVCIEWIGVATVERWALTVNPELADASALSACASTNTILSPGLDEIMVNLDDIKDLLQET